MRAGLKPLLFVVLGWVLGMFTFAVYQPGIRSEVRVRFYEAIRTFDPEYSCPPSERVILQVAPWYELS